MSPYNVTSFEADEPGEDFWQSMYKWHGASIFSAISGAYTIFQFPFVINIYFHNKNKHFRTILHSLECFIILQICFYMIFMHFTAYCRLWLGPMPIFLCWFRTFIMNSTSLILTTNVLIITRYFYVFVIKNWALVKEDLLVWILGSVILMLSTIFGLLYMLSPGKFGANYYMCLGEDPSQDPYDHGKFPFPVLVYLVFLLVYPILSIKLNFVKRQKLVNTSQLDKDSSVDLATFAGGLFIIIVDAILWSSFNKLDVSEMKQPNTLASWAAFGHNHIAFDLLTTLFCLRTYIKKPFLYKIMFRNLVDLKDQIMGR